MCLWNSWMPMVTWPASNIGVTLNPATALTVTITDDEAGTATIAGGSILYTFQFSETVTGFDAADITVVNGTKGTFTAVDGDTYTLVVTPTAGFQGILAVGVAAGVAFDAAVTPNTAAALSVQVVDTLAPVASITLDAITADNIVNAAEAGGTVAVTGTVGGDVEDSDIITLTVNGVAYTGTSTGGVFSIDVAGSGLLADPDLTVDASVTATDASGNATTATADQAYTVAAVIIGDTTGAVVEAGGVANGTPGTPTDTGDLNSIDVDDPNDAWEVVSFPTASTYGTFTIDAAGVWTYTLDNTNTAVQALNVGRDADRHVHRHDGRRHRAAGDHHHQRQERRRSDQRRRHRVGGRGRRGRQRHAGADRDRRPQFHRRRQQSERRLDGGRHDTGRQRLRQLHAHRRRGVDLHAGRQQCGGAGAQCGRDADRHLHGGDNGRHPAAGDHHHQRQQRRRRDHRPCDRRGGRGRRRQ